MTTTAHHYGDDLADLYDLIYPETPDIADAVRFIGERTPDAGRVLEFGAGTGRLTCPLAEAGLGVEALDASARMLELLDEKAGARGLSVPTHEGDFTAYRCPGSFDTVVIALNSLFMVPTQAGQINCLDNARRHLGPDGVVVVEVYDPTRMHSLPTATETMVHHLDADSLLINDLMVDRVGQRAMITQSLMRDGTLRKVHEMSRYAFPAELDLMAQVAGLELVERYEGWSTRPFEFRSQGHVSVYRPIRVEDSAAGADAG